MYHFTDTGDASANPTKEKKVLPLRVREMKVSGLREKILVYSPVPVRCGKQKGHKRIDLESPTRSVKLSWLLTASVPSYS